MKEILAKLEAILLTIQHPFLRDSESSLSKEELIHLFNANKLALNEELIDLYLWKGGLNGVSIYNDSYIELCSYGCYIDCRSACSLYLLDRFSENELNGKLPIIQSDSGDFIAVDLNKKGTTNGQLFVSSPSITLSSEFVSIYDSIHNFLITIIECYRLGAYKLSNNKLEVDYKLEAEISRKHNPNSDFWKEL